MFMLKIGIRNPLELFLYILNPTFHLLFRDFYQSSYHQKKE